MIFKPHLDFICHWKMCSYLPPCLEVGPVSVLYYFTLLFEFFFSFFSFFFSFYFYSQLLLTKISQRSILIWRTQRWLYREPGTPSSHPEPQQTIRTRPPRVESSTPSSHIYWCLVSVSISPAREAKKERGMKDWAKCCCVGSQ